MVFVFLLQVKASLLLQDKESREVFLYPGMKTTESLYKNSKVGFASFLMQIQNVWSEILDIRNETILIWISFSIWYEICISPGIIKTPKNLLKGQKFIDQIFSKTLK